MYPMSPEQMLVLHHLRAGELQAEVAAARLRAARRDRARAVRLAAKAERLAVRAARRALSVTRTA